MRISSISGRLGGLAAVVAIGLTAVSCGSDSDSADTTTPPTAASTTVAEASSTSAAAPAPADDPLAPKPLAERRSVTLATSAFRDSSLQILLADYFGEFEKENLDASIEVVPLTDGAVLLAQGKVDAMIGALGGAYWNLLGSGTEMRAVLPVVKAVEGSPVKQGMWIRKAVVGDDGLQASDLVGKKVGAQGGAGSAFFANLYYKLLEPAGADVSDLKLEEITADVTPEALKRGAIDAAFVYTPHWERLVGDDCCVFAEEYSGFYPTFASSQIFVGSSILDGDPEFGEAVVRAIMRTVRTYLQGEYQNDPEVAAAAADILGIPIEDFQSRAPLYFDPEFELDVEDNMAIQDYFFVLGDVLDYDQARALSAEDVFDPSFRDAVLGTS